MALKKCKECGNDVSTKATSCPKCGAVLKKKAGCLTFIGAVILILIILGVIGSLINSGNKKSTSSKSSSVSSKSQPEVEKKVYKEGETVNIGYTSYAVWRSWWSSSLSSNQYLDRHPNAMYLFVELTVQNNDKKSRMIPPFKLVDENGAEHETSSNSGSVEGSIGIIESLNPSVSKQGLIVFDVPEDRTYSLKLSGGFWSLEDAYVKLSPRQSR